MTEGAGVGIFLRIAKGLRDGNKPILTPRRHSSEGWNLGREAAGVNEWQVLMDGAFGYRACVLSFPLKRE